jgi:hypothetical protein
MGRVRVFTFLLVLVFGFDLGYSQSKNLPLWVKDEFNKKELNKKYDFGTYLTPSFLIADLDGDKGSDAVILIVEKKSSKKGVLIIHKNSRYYILGAGNEFGNGGDDFKWANKWNILSKKTVYETIIDEKTGDIIGGKKRKLLHPTIELEDKEQGAGGLIYWDGKKYIWIHQGE